MFDELIELSQKFLRVKYTPYYRYFLKAMPLKYRFSIILGERGIGKTTLMIQYLIKAAHGNPLSHEILYVQADHFLIQRATLYEIAESFTQLGGKVIAFDEIHKYPNWSMELKSIYDTFPDLRIIASGSSALEIHRGTHDLSRRATVYRMFGSSLREFIELKYHMTLPVFKLEEIVLEHSQLCLSIIEQLAKQDLKILKLFKDYLEYGYYPYFLEFDSVDEFKMTVEQNLHTTLESDLVAIYPDLSGNSIKKIKQLVTYLAQTVPFIPNWQAIKKITDIGDDRTIKNYFKYLEDSYIIVHLKNASEKMKGIENSEKIFIANPNQLYAFGAIHPNVGTVRETFFLCNLRHFHEVTLARKTDFLVDNKYYFEIGGKNKDSRQLQGEQNSFLALDDIELGANKRIPLWLFGFLY